VPYNLKGICRAGFILGHRAGSDVFGRGNKNTKFAPEVIGGIGIARLMEIPQLPPALSITFSEGWFHVVLVLLLHKTACLEGRKDCLVICGV
jgi:hypothetical protein